MAISETNEFLSIEIDDLFEEVIESGDIRAISLKKFVKTLENTRNKRTGNLGDRDVIVSVQSLDSLKYTSQALKAFTKRAIENVKSYGNPETGECLADIYIAAFKEGKPTSGYKASIFDFIKEMGTYQGDESLTEDDNNRFYLRDFPKKILDSEKTDFFIFAEVQNLPSFDRAIISIIGVPEDEIDAIRKAAILKMFGK